MSNEEREQCTEHIFADTGRNEYRGNDRNEQQLSDHTVSVTCLLAILNHLIASEFERSQRLESDAFQIPINRP